MTWHRLELLLLPHRLAVCRLPGGAEIPGWATQGAFFSVTRAAGELSVVCPESLVPQNVRMEPDWRALRLAGVMDLSVVGVLASLALPLSNAGISLFAVSTFDTDYLLIKQHDLGRAIEALSREGHAVVEDSP